MKDIKEVKKNKNSFLLFIALRIVALIIAGIILYFLSNTFQNKLNIYIISLIAYFLMAIIPNFFIELEEIEYFGASAIPAVIISVLGFIKYLFEINFTFNYESKLGLIFYILFLIIITAAITAINLFIDRVYRFIKSAMK